MDPQPATIEHTCNAVRRQIQQEFPDLDLIFVIARKGHIEEALERKRGELDNPDAERLLQALLKTGAEGTTCIIAKVREKKLIPLFAKKKTLAAILIFADKSHTDLERLRQRTYAMAWHVLNVVVDPGFEKRLDKDSTMTLAYEDETALAWSNMLADSFSALVLEVQGKKGAIRALAKRRSTMALEAHPDYMAEHYPYPIVMDAALLVYDDARREGTLAKDKPFTRALEMTKEIGITFDQATVLQWWAFGRPAQEMAWLNIDKSNILGTAVHTSEDPYARSTAYMVAELLGIEPAPVTASVSIYNAFTDMEVNERHHRKLCDDLFQSALSKAAVTGKAEFLRREAARQNKTLLEGQLVSWCTPGLLAAADAFETAPLEEGKNIEAARDAFKNFAAKMNGEALRKLGQILINLRRTGGETGPEHVAVALREDTDLQSFSDALLIHPETGR
jgi:hypothetical protein